MMFGLLNSTLLAVLSAPLALWLCQLSLIIGVRLYHIRDEIFNWFGIDKKRRRLIASVMMLIGWGTLAVPTGIVTAEMTARRHARPLFQLARACSGCGAAGYGPEAKFCQQCGAALPPAG